MKWIWSGLTQRSDALERQAEADASLDIARQGLAEVRDLDPVVDEKVGIWHRLNRENNFAIRVELAYRGLDQT